MSDIKISVVVPVYNVAPYLARCLDSLVGQTMSDIEIICIDDKSTDNSLEILQEYENKYPQIHVIALDKNSGVATARNAGIDAARGEYLGFVDSDDYIDADFYEKLYATAKKENADMVRGNLKIVQYDGSVLKDHNEIKNVDKYGKWYFNWQWWCAIYSANMLTVKRLRFPTDVISGQDTVFLMACISHANKVATVHDVFYHYIRREGSLDEQIMPPHKIASRIKAHAMMADIYNNADISQHYYCILYNRLIGGLWIHFHKNTSANCKRDIATALIELYKKNKAKPQFRQYCDKFGPDFMKHVQSHNIDGIIEIWSAILPVKQVNSGKKYLLFGFLPVCKYKRTSSKFILKLFGLQVLKIKYGYDNYKMYILYIPILRTR